MDSTFQMSASAPNGIKPDGKTRVPAAVGTFLVFGQACSIKGWAMGCTASVDTISGATITNYCLRDQHSMGQASVAGMEARVMASASTSLAVQAVADPMVSAMYIGVWQASQALASPAIHTGNWLSMSTNMQMANTHGSALATALQFSRIISNRWEYRFNSWN